MTSTLLITATSGQSCTVLEQRLASTGLFGTILVRPQVPDALELLERHPVDLLCCELTPGEEGPFDLLARLRETGRSELPLVLFQRGNEPELRVRALESGAADCLAWEMPAGEITARLNRALQTKKALDLLRRQNADLAQMALTDGLTGLYNRTFFDDLLPRQIALSRRTGRQFSLLLVDIDHFKRINDLYGHLAGDRALQAVGSVLGGMLRKSDSVCRYGGEEFAVLLPETPAAEAAQVAEKIRSRIASLSLKHEGEAFRLAVSIGVSTAGAGSKSAHTLLTEADRALYAAKAKGRNRTEIYQPSKPGRLLNPAFPNLDYPMAVA